METSLKTSFAQIFSYFPKTLSCSNFGGTAAPSPLTPHPSPPPAHMPMFQSRPSHMEAIQFNSIFIHTFIKYLHKGEEEGKKKQKINGLDRSVRWSEELSFRANHRYIMSGNT